MISYHNSTRMKIVRDMCDFHKLDPRLIPIMDFMDQVVEKVTVGISHLIITSLYRPGSKDHETGSAYDARARNLTAVQSNLVAQRVCEKFPVPTNQRPTIKFWSPKNSTRLRCPAGHWKIDPTRTAVIPIKCPVCGDRRLKKTFYAPHFHVRVEPNLLRFRNLTFPLTELGDNG